MKTTIGRLKTLIKEAVNGVQELEGYRVGTWYKLIDGHVTQLVGIEPLNGAEDIMMASYTDGGGITRQRRFDHWVHDVAEEASPEDIQKSQAGAAAGNEFMSKHVDTGHEGT